MIISAESAAPPSDLSASESARSRPPPLLPPEPAKPHRVLALFNLSVPKNIPLLLFPILFIPSLLLSVPTCYFMSALSLTCILLSAHLAGYLFSRFLLLPALIGQLLTGILFALLFPAFTALPPPFFTIPLKTLSLAVLLIRAGLCIKLPTVRPHLSLAVALSFVPFLVEAVAVCGVSVVLLLTFPAAALLACLVGDVSPAVTTPILIELKAKYQR